MRVVIFNRSADGAGIIVGGGGGAGGGLFQRVGFYGLGGEAVIAGGIDYRVLVPLIVADGAFLMFQAGLAAGGPQVCRPIIRVAEGGRFADPAGRPAVFAGLQRIAARDARRFPCFGIEKRVGCHADRLAGR